MSLRHSPRFSPSVPAVRRTAWRTGALALALFAGVACGEDDKSPVEPPEPVDIVLSDTSITLIRGQTDTKQITASVVGTDNTGLTWTIGDSRIATISPTGMVTAVSDGSTFATAVSTADPSKNRSVVINVVSTVVTVTPPTAFSWVGGPTRQLSVTVENNANKAVTWRSSNTAVATVSSTGVVTPVGTGTASIIAQSVAQPSKESATAFTVDPAVDPSATRLTSGVAVTGISGATGDQLLYYIAVPVGATSLQVSLVADNGDADIYVRRTSLDSGSGCNAATVAASESCTVTNPQSRLYYILVDAYAGFTGATLTATVTP